MLAAFSRVARAGDGECRSITRPQRAVSRPLAGRVLA